jgi:hypothetical protein
VLLFWSGNSYPKSAVADRQRNYCRLFELANITRADGSLKRCHPHMFRNTFAVEMLLADVPIDQVSLLLGHASVKVAEKSCAPFVKARQIQLQDSVRNAWSIGIESAPDPAKAASFPSTQSSSQTEISVHRSSAWEVIVRRNRFPNRRSEVDWRDRPDDLFSCCRSVCSIVARLPRGENRMMHFSSRLLE